MNFLNFNSNNDTHLFVDGSIKLMLLSLMPPVFDAMQANVKYHSYLKCVGVEFLLTI